MQKRKRIEVLREVFVVTEWRDGAVYRTKSLGNRWVGIDEVPTDGERYASPNAGPDDQTIRTIFE